jgi:hypothetical protein
MTASGFRCARCRSRSFINIGDILEVLTNENYRSREHWVKLVLQLRPSPGESSARVRALHLANGCIMHRTNPFMCVRRNKTNGKCPRRIIQDPYVNVSKYSLLSQRSFKLGPLFPKILFQPFPLYYFCRPSSPPTYKFFVCLIFTRVNFIRTNFDL